MDRVARKEKSKKRKPSRSSSASPSSPDRNKKKKKKREKDKSRTEKKASKKAKKKKKSSKRESSPEADYGIPIDLMNSKVRAPESREDYEARQSQVKRVFDADTGRTRLIKGDGEVIEEIVSKQRHDEINRQATAAEGSNYERHFKKEKTFQNKFVEKE